MNTYQYVTNSNAAPFLSDTYEGFIEAATAIDALRKVVDEYKHPCGLFAAVIKLPTVENTVVARYLSNRAVTQESAKCGLCKWEGDNFYLNGELMPLRCEKWEDLECKN